MTLKKTAKENFAAWVNALEDKDIERLASLYTRDATFLPTLSADFKTGPSGAEEYFRDFLRRNPTGKMIQETVQWLGNDSYLHSGFYDFEVDDETGKTRIIARARFTFAWKREPDGTWKIFHHHSSIMPAE